MFSLIFLLTLLGTAIAKNAREGSQCFPERTRFIDEAWGNSYFECQFGRTVRRFCPPNYQVNPRTIECVYGTRTTWPTWPTVATTTLPSPICKPGTRTPYPFDNTKYLQCDWIGMGWKIFYCQPNSVFDARTGTCVSVSTTTRTPHTTTTPFYGPCTESGGAAGYKPDIRSCQHYYQCASGVWLQRPCPAGTVWSQKLLTCDHNRGQCRTGVTVAPQPSTISSTIQV